MVHCTFYTAPVVDGSLHILVRWWLSSRSLLLRGGVFCGCRVIVMYFFCVQYFIYVCVQQANPKDKRADQQIQKWQYTNE